MTNTARGRMYARLIRAGRLTLAEVPEDQKQDTRDAYYALYHEILPEGEN